MNKVILRAPVLSQSGYGEHARFVLRSLRSQPDKFDIYKIKDKNNAYHTVDAEVFDKACQDVKKDFIEIVFISYQHNIAEAWFSEIVAKSKNILESIGNRNEVYWQTLRTEVEMWQLNFLRYHSTFYRYNTEFNVELTDDNIFDKEVYKEWNDDYKEDMQVITLCYNEVKYALNNLATPGHTHDEQALQKVSETTNERILLLSFLAMSIPMLGAIFSPKFSLHTKIFSASILLLLPIFYFSVVRFTKKRQIKLDKRRELMRRKKQMLGFLEYHRNNIEEIEKGDLADDVKKNIIVWEERNIKVGQQMIDKIDKKLK